MTTKPEPRTAEDTIAALMKDIAGPHEAGLTMQGMILQHFIVFGEQVRAETLEEAAKLAAGYAHQELCKPKQCDDYSAPCELVHEIRALKTPPRNESKESK